LNFKDFIKTRVFWVNLILAFLVFFISIFIIMQSLKWYTNHGDSVTVPEMKGMSYKQALDKLEDLNLEFSVADTSFDPKKPAGTILDQNPMAGSKVKENRIIYLTINASKPPNREVPDLVGKSSYKFATIQLEGRGFKVGDPIYKQNPDLNAVLDVLYKGRSVKKGEMLPIGSELILVLGNGMGNTKVDVPFIVGLTYSEALTVLQENGFTLGALVVDADVSDTSSAKVYSQMPEPGDGNQLRVGESVDIFIKSTMTVEEVDLYKQNMIEKYGKPEEEENAGEASDPNNIPNETP
jgi:beta-lactam-binding protein with PASTA domain